ncbi:MAG TPA: right-handed parallel beta-helix repeat-containing protein [Alphaproteobacteria bacterium]|nr:right-handed parallel beta-helix repeat-containing protein [Alphaproteobacteria bacterium]
MRAPSGQTVTLTIPAAAITGAVNGPVVSMAADSVLSGISVANTSTAPARDGILVQGATGARIVGNVVTVETGGAIDVIGARSVVISGNTIAAGDEAIVLSDADYATISGNTIAAPGSTGIFMQDSNADVTISDNVFGEMAYQAIVAGATIGDPDSFTAASTSNVLVGPLGSLDRCWEGNLATTETIAFVDGIDCNF